MTFKQEMVNFIAEVNTNAYTSLMYDNTLIVPEIEQISFLL